MKIVEFLRPDCVIDNLTGRTGQAVLSELCRPLAQGQKVEEALRAFQRYTVTYQPAEPLASIHQQRYRVAG